jgi:hypothetical protein
MKPRRAERKPCQWNAERLKKALKNCRVSARLSRSSTSIPKQKNARCRRRSMGHAARHTAADIASACASLCGPGGAPGSGREEGAAARGVMQVPARWLQARRAQRQQRRSRGPREATCPAGAEAGLLPRRGPQSWHPRSAARTCRCRPVPGPRQLVDDRVCDCGRNAQHAADHEACRGVHHARGTADAEDALGVHRQGATHGDEAVLLLLDRLHL